MNILEKIDEILQAVVGKKLGVRYCPRCEENVYPIELCVNGSNPSCPQCQLCLCRDCEKVRRLERRR